MILFRNIEFIILILQNKFSKYHIYFSRIRVLQQTWVTEIIRDACQISTFHFTTYTRWSTWSKRYGGNVIHWFSSVPVCLVYIHYEGDVEMELNSRRRVETDLPRRSIRCQLDAISERCPTILRLSSVPTFSIIRLILRLLQWKERALKRWELNYSISCHSTWIRRNLRECSYA